MLACCITPRHPKLQTNRACLACVIMELLRWIARARPVMQFQQKRSSESTGGDQAAEGVRKPQACNEIQRSNG